MAEMKREYGMGRVIIVADKGINTAPNIVYSLLRGDGYVYSQTIRGGNKELKDYALDKRGYRAHGDNNRIKSRLYPREIVLKDIKGKRQKVRIDEKQVIFYSLKYDKRAKAEREPALQKAMDLVNNPGKYNKATSCGAAKYVKNLQFDKDSGEIVTTTVSRPVLNKEKIREEELYDGYYVIVTSEYKKTDKEIIEIYRGLWRIEESFRVTKSDLETRPIYMSREDHIEAHFLICFLALAIARILEYRFDKKYSISRISESLRNASCSVLEENWYVLDYTDDVIHDLNEKLGIDLSRKYLRLGDIRKILGTTKKPESPTIF
jgi:hypothetical protein